MYNEFYDLSEKPFELLPDPKFLFLTTSHREIIASMMNGIRNRKGFISITGEVGTGKTTLIRFLLGKLEIEEKIKTVFIFHPTITFKELLRNILLELDLEVMKASKGALLRHLNEYLTQMTHKGETLVVMIDEAQDLSREVMGELGMLPKLAALQVVFVGQPEFEDKLNSQGLRPLKQRIEIKHQIRAFSERESEDYIDHRLRLVRSSSSERFTPRAVSLICSHAQGIPRIINILCDNALLRGYRLSQKRIDVDIIHDVIKDMENPFPQRPFFPPIIKTAKALHLFLPKANFLQSKTFLVGLSFLCLGGFVFLIDRLFQPRPARTWDIQSLKTPSADTRPSLTPPSFPKVNEEISNSDTSQRPLERKPISPELTKPVPLSDAPLTLLSEEEPFEGIETVRRGQTIYSLTKKYYRTVNKTLMDFILDSNPEIKDVHLILVDQQIKIPKITEELLIIKTGEHTYKINAGTFQTPHPAKIYSDEQTLKEKKIEILPQNVSPRETWYQVVIGKFHSEDEVLKTIDLLKEKGLLPAFGGLPDIK
jgi:type II secretory pathway predicted ATPase ExeA